MVFFSAMHADEMKLFRSDKFLCSFCFRYKDLRFVDTAALLPAMVDGLRADAPSLSEFLSVVKEQCARARTILINKYVCCTSCDVHASCFCMCMFVSKERNDCHNTRHRAQERKREVRKNITNSSKQNARRQLITVILAHRQAMSTRAL